MADTANNTDSMPVEEWRDIPGWDGYQASSLGRVRSLDKYVLRRNRAGEYRAFVRGRVLSPAPHYKQRYMKVCIKGADGKPKTPYVHSLVCLAFHGRKPEGYDVAHSDGVKSNNRPDNLRWATRKDNCADKWAHGTMVRGERSPSAKRTEKDVLEIRRLLSLGLNQTQVAKIVGLDSRRVSEIASRKKWAYLE